MDINCGVIVDGKASIERGRPAVLRDDPQDRIGPAVQERDLRLRRRRVRAVGARSDDVTRCKCHSGGRHQTEQWLKTSSKDLFEFFQKMWNPTSFPIPGMFTPTMDVGGDREEDRRAAAVENWLKMNLTFLQMTIKTLEMQKSALQTLQEAGQEKGSSQIVRINNVGPQVVIAPEVRGSVDQVRATAAR